MTSKGLALINVITYIMLIPAAIWIGPIMMPEHTTTYFMAVNGGGIALMNIAFLTEK